MTLPRLILSKEALRLGSDRELRRLHTRGSLVRIRTGVYAETETWGALDADARYREFVRASALVSAPGAQFSHDSAAALWRLPSIDPWPHGAHELVPRSAGGNSRRGIRRHALGLDPTPTVIDAVTVTSLVRTLLDICSTASFVRAVTMVDDALRPTREGDDRHGWGTPLPTVDELLDELAGLLPYPGSTRAQRAIQFANGGSGSPGETFSRVQFHALGYPAPQLQVPFYDADGFIGDADFYFRDLDLISEFDGASKYGAARRYQRHLSLDEIVMAEKVREDRMRRVVKSFARLRWPTVRNRRMLAEYLAPFGLVAR